MILSTSVILLLAQAVQAQVISPAARAAFDYAQTARDGNDQPLVQVSDPSQGRGEALLTIMPGEREVQQSNFNWRSFQLTNTGEKRIVAAFIDVTDALFPDIVFDEDGTGGDDVAKVLSHDWGTTETLPVAIDQYQWQWLPARGSDFVASAEFSPAELDDVNNLFVNELSNSGLGAAGGFRGELILFEDFGSAETYEFSGDMDPNSLAGLSQGSVGLHAEWDVGGVSGAEMIGSVVSVLFGDGTTASGTIAADNSQAGSVAVISNDLMEAPGLAVGDVDAGESGTYSTSSLPVVVTAPAGSTVRVSMVQAFDPVDNEESLAGGLIALEALVAARLIAQYPTFPVNNAKSWQHIDVVMPQSGSIDIGNQFSLSDEVTDALGFVAVVIESDTRLPMSRTSAPIRLLYTEAAPTGSSLVTCRWGESFGNLAIRGQNQYSGLDVEAPDESLDQEWDFEPVEGGYFVIRNRSSGNVLTRRASLQGGTWNPNTLVDTTHLRPTWASQQWRFECENDGWCRIVNRWGNDGYLNRPGVFENGKWQPESRVYLSRKVEAWWSQQWRVELPN